MSRREGKVRRPSTSVARGLTGMIEPVKRPSCNDSSSLNPMPVFSREAPTIAMVLGEKNGLSDSMLSACERTAVILLKNGDSLSTSPSNKPLGLEKQDRS